MGLFKKLFSKTVGDVVEKVGDAFDKNFTSEDERLQARNELQRDIQSNFAELAGMQENILKTELSGNWLQRSWRPIVMLIFAFIVAYSKFIAPAFDLPNTVLEPDFWNLLEIGIGGYVIGRSAEKITDKIDLKNIIRKK